MVDIHALNVLLLAVPIICAVAIGSAAGAIVLAWLADRRHNARSVARGVRAVEAHLADAARDRIAH